MKIPCSKVKLARKGTLFEVVVSVDGFNLQALSHVLGISCHNLSHVLEQKQLVQSFSLSPFSLFGKRKRQNGLTIETKRLMLLWCTTKT